MDARTGRGWPSCHTPGLSLMGCSSSSVLHKRTCRSLCATAQQGRPSSATTNARSHTLWLTSHSWFNVWIKTNEAQYTEQPETPMQESPKSEVSDHAFSVTISFVTLSGLVREGVIAALLVRVAFVQFLERTWASAHRSCGTCVTKKEDPFSNFGL